MNDHTWDADSVKDWSAKTNGTGGLVSFSRGENPLRADKLNAAFAERVWREGDTMQGTLVLAHDPSAPLDAATKQYVDRFTSVGVPVGAYIGTAPPGDTLSRLWWDSISGQLFIQYNDGTSTQWVVANSVGISTTVPRLNISNIPLAKPDGSPPDGSSKGDLYSNGGFVCVAP